MQNQELTLDLKKFDALPRKKFPLKNFIAQTLMDDYRKWFKGVGKGERIE